MRVLLVTSDRKECGIRSYGEMLMEYMPREEGVEIVEFPQPNWHALSAYHDEGFDFDIVHVNHHQALHSSWKPEHIQAVQRWGKKIVVTQHDSFETFAIMQERGFPDFRGADALVVHEPVEGLTHDWAAPRVHYLRQGVPIQKHLTRGAREDRPVAGTAGFPFPWKNTEVLLRATAAAGWGIRIIAPGATIEQCMEWIKLNPNTEIIPWYMDRHAVVNHLAHCDANIFHYVTGNSGTTGTVRLALAALRPVISTGPMVNRQIRDLANEKAIIWANTEEDLTHWLTVLEKEPVTRCAYEADIVDLAHKDSWHKQALAYSEIYRAVLR